MLNFKHNDIKNETDAGSYQRGFSYFQQGMVESISSEQVGKYAVSVSGEVNGSNYMPYNQGILIKQKGNGEINIRGLCDCPVGFNCKHVVAVCLEYLAKNNAIVTDAANSIAWLNDFSSAGEQAASYSSSVGTDFISYALMPTKADTGLSVRLLRNRYLKKGGLGKGWRINLYEFNQPYARPDYIQKIDEEIAKIVEALNEHVLTENELMLFGDLGYLALSKMVETGRCHWLSPQNSVVTMGSQRDLKFSWQTNARGEQRLDVNVEPACLILRTQPALYLDEKTSEIGEIKGADFTFKQWQMLLTMPPIPVESCQQFSQQLITKHPDSPFPPPIEITTLRVTEPLTPGLFLYSEVDPYDGSRIHFMGMRGFYGEHEINLKPPLPVSNFIKGNNAITVHRNLVAEKSALDMLKNEGFQVASDERDEAVVLAAASSVAHQTNADCWQRFLQITLPNLEQQGWRIEKDNSFQIEFLQVDNWDVEIESDNDWFDLRFDLDVDGEKIPLLPLIAEVLHNYELNNLPEIISLPLANSKYLQIPSERIRPIFQTLYELFNADSMDESGKLRLSRFDATRLAELEENCSTELNWRGGKAMRQLGRKLKSFTGIRKVKPPRGLKASLRDYQQQGLNWLQFLREFSFNGILADDMGLGKTVQALAHLLKEKEAKRLTKPCLIIAPTSLMSNWRREAERFAPKLKVLVLQGTERKQHFDKIEQYDLVLSTYPLLVRDHEILLASDYYYLILDEAQVIKNARSKAARVVRDINCEHRLCLTGTPMENHLGELWALFDFLMPGCLGDQKSFNQVYRYPIEKHGDDEQRQRLVRRIAPFMLRRSKSEVATELPEKTEIIRATIFDKQQAALYESIRLSMQKKVRDAIKEKGFARSHITILDALLKLRQTCCDPKLLSLAQAKKVKSSAKLEMLMEMLPEMLEEGRRILLFSQFTKMLAIIEQELKNKNISYSKLTGQTIKRDAAIERFKCGEADVFLISLKAGGVGLNLTEADTVIHYDPWWNPAVERQATDRAHRIGQDKAVFVYKLIAENTLEEKILEMQARKQALADGVYSKDGAAKELKLTSDDLQALFSPLSGS